MNTPQHSPTGDEPYDTLFQLAYKGLRSQGFTPQEADERIRQSVAELKQRAARDMADMLKKVYAVYADPAQDLETYLRLEIGSRTQEAKGYDVTGEIR